MLDVDRSRSGQDNRAALHNLAFSWFQWHMIDSSWWGGYKPLIFPSDQEEEDREHFFVILSEFSQAYLFGFSPSNLFRDLAKYAPSQEVKFLSLLSAGKCFTRNLLQLFQPALSSVRKHKLTSKQFIKNLDGNLPATLYVFCKP